MAARTGKRRIWLRIAVGVTVIVVALAGLLVGARYWLTTDGGRAFLVSQIDGRRAGPMGVVRISGLTGDPFTSASVADIAFVDDDGVWLRAHDAHVRWTPFDLISSNLNIAVADVRLIDVQRRPRVSPRPNSSSGGNIGVRLKALSIEELKIAEGVAGPAASYRISGGGVRAKDNSGSLRIDVTPLAGPDDQLKAEAEWSVSGVLSGQVNASGPAGGVLAGLIRAPADAPVALDATLSGSLTRFDADIRLAFAGESVAIIAARRDAAIATVEASLQSARWPLLEELTNRAGNEIVLTGEAAFGSDDVTAISLDATTEAGDLSLSGTLNTKTLSLSGPVRVSGSNLDLAGLSPPLSGRATAAGDLTFGGGNTLSWAGDVAIDDFTFPGGGAKHVGGPVEIDWSGATLSWLAPKVAITGGMVTSLSGLGAATYDGASRGEVNFTTRQVDVLQAQLRGVRGDASARGTYFITNRTFDFSGAARIARLSDVAPLSGSARGQWRVRQSASNAPIRISADMTGQGVSAENALLAGLLGETPRIAMSAATRNGRFIVETGRIDTPSLDGRLEGRVTDAGAISGRARLALTRPVSSGGVKLNAADLAATLSGTMSEPRIELTVNDAALAAGGMDFSDLSGLGHLTLGRLISGDIALSGDASGQPLEVSSRLEGDADAIRMPGLQASLGGFTASAPRLSIARDGVEGALIANGSLAGLFDVQRGSLNATGEFSTRGDRPSFILDASATDVRRGEMRIQSATISARGSDQGFTATGKSRGLVGASLDLDWSADAQPLDEAGWTGSATLAGTVDGLPVATAEPVEWSWTGEGWDISGSLAALGGTASVAAASYPAASEARLDLVDVDLQALTRLARVTPYTGQLSGHVVFSNTDGVATGDIALNAVNANPVGITADPASLSLTGKLADGRLAAMISGLGQGFRLEGEGDMRVETGQGFNIQVSRTAPLSARLALNGRIAPLWAVFGPEDQSLRGQVTANLLVSGTFAKPGLEGDFAIANGAFDHGETGLQLRAITLDGEFNQSSARIASLSATDGNGGRLTAEGEITWTGEIDGGATFEARNFRALGRDDRFAVMSGKGGVDLKRDAVVVSGDFEVAQARFSVEQPASASIPTLPYVRRVNFANATDDDALRMKEPTRPVTLDLQITAPRRIVVFGRGLDMEWGADFKVTGAVANPIITGSATLVRGSLDLAGQRFAFDSGAINLDGPIRSARIDVSATRSTADIEARVRLTGTPVEPEFILESTPALPQDEILARILFNRAASELSGLEAAQLAAALTQLAGGQAAFDPGGLLRDFTGLDRVSIGAEGDTATVSAGKYIADNVYLQIGAGGEGGVGAQVEWEPVEEVSVISSARDNGDTKIALRWKHDY